jgi:hypothetical protein
MRLRIIIREAFATADTDFTDRFFTSFFVKTDYLADNEMCLFVPCSPEPHPEYEHKAELALACFKKGS